MTAPAGGWIGQVDYLVVVSGGRSALFDATGARLTGSIANAADDAAALLAALRDLQQRLGRRTAQTAVKLLSDNAALLRQLAGVEPAAAAEIQAALAAFQGYRLGQQPAADLAQLLDS